MKEENIQSDWRYTALTPRFFSVDARAIFPLGLWFLHWSKLTFTVALISIIALVVLERLHMPLQVCVLYLRVLLVGSVRPAHDTFTFRVRSRF
jgi:hypothetical protein